MVLKGSLITSAGVFFFVSFFFFLPVLFYTLIAGSILLVGVLHSLRDLDFSCFCFSISSCG